ncbi:DUF2550 family protein [Nakamurella sp. YIM 132087]|uniref:DUF2550 family protein n=1 Tax=Nakamurella alba TaxID=2665158 RepID=A0A7K1FL98_9ACTN|nr:DUF2550 domain-containing protein [Nakamurella alba]MTD13654.1 DUF2550 family protein [Nakamurella alba]
MQAPELIGLLLLVALVLTIAAIAVRRSLLTRSGGIDICWRTAVTPDGRGWIFGQGKFDDRGLVLYRSFSPLPLPSRVLERDQLEIDGRRSPQGAEPDLLPVGAVILRCTDRTRALELALSEQVLTGLRSWLESVPPQQRGLRGDSNERGGLREL